MLNEVPPGLPNVIGSPTKYPCRSRDEAWAYAKAIIGVLKHSGPAPEAKHADEIPFDFDDVTLFIPRALYIEVEKLSGDLARFPEDYLEDITSRGRAQTGGRLSAEKFAAMAEQQRAVVMTAATFALLKGHVRWPPNLYDERTDGLNRPILSR